MKPDEKYTEASKRMFELLNELRMSEDELGIRIGSRKGDIIRNILKMRNGISHNVANRIVEQFPQFRYEWIRHGHGNKYASEEDIHPVNNCAKCKEKDELIKELNRVIDHYREIIAEKNEMLKMLKN